MKNQKLNILFILIIILITLSLFLAKDKLNCFVTKYNLNNNGVVISQTDSLKYLAQFNNSNKAKIFQISLIELGGKGCKPCMKMDTVLSEIKEEYKEKINIKIVRVTDDNGKKVAKYFGVNAIPTQIIIDKNGKEVFRHTGFISKTELRKIKENRLRL